MEQQERTFLIVGARLLAYPEETFLDELEDIKDEIKTNNISPDKQQKMIDALQAFNHYTIKELQTKYVSTFDLRAKNGLYLTAHELGDSNKRGAALIKLQNIINQAGYERIDEDLSDYIPMLLEFLAVAPDSSDNERLIRRLGIAIYRIMSNLPEENPYRQFLQLLMDAVFAEPTKQEMEKLEYEREEADLEELPFPIMYG
ncbi:nitrate reductase molybdenum cofactor assembly chaperone [Lentibacillus cibarius]|uniref:Nitrate reductase molybdenum cofactor assembly chaperone n=1 Tax=Lentibacillus cibarius TaxID=2583219 RepID=A0A5S3QR18_9BACI|nr:nitrate reductase molybdenum cofactor assembly chaperone [Lentibacillus cibarius]TMN23681.1 nitrate reductase molybdenum cofactor assembly chaperone [Lentibacillus cibarius]